MYGIEEINAMNDVPLKSKTAKSVQEIEEQHKFSNNWQKLLVDTVAEFYLLEAIINTHCTTPYSPFYQGAMKKVKTAKEEVTKKLVTFFKTYILLSGVGEFRHAKDQCFNTPVPVPVSLQTIAKKPMYRDKAWQRAWGLMKLPHKKLLVIVHFLYVTFVDGDWASGFGGKRWAKIMKCLLDYLEGAWGMTDTVFIDTAVNLIHNNSLFVDKLLGGYRTRAFQKVLAAKAKAKTLKELYEVYNSIDADWLDKQGQPFSFNRLEGEHLILCIDRWVGIIDFLDRHGDK